MKKNIPSQPALLLLALLIVLATRVTGQDFIVYKTGLIIKGTLIGDPDAKGLQFRQGNSRGIIDRFLVSRVIATNHNRHKKPLAVISLPDTSLSGHILYADSTGLILNLVGKTYDPKDSANFSRFIAVADIQSILLKRNRGYGRSALNGFLISFTVGAVLGGVAFGSQTPDRWFYVPPLEGAAVTGVVLGPVGGLIGLVVAATGTSKIQKTLDGKNELYWTMLDLLKKAAILRTPPLEWQTTDTNLRASGQADK